MRMVNTGVVGHGHGYLLGVVIVLSEWGSSSGNTNRCREFPFWRGLGESMDVIEG